MASADADTSIGIAAPTLGNGASAVALDSAGNVYVTGLRIGIDERIVAASPSDSIGVVKITPKGNPLQFPADGLSSLVRNVPFLTSIEVAPFSSPTQSAAFGVFL